MDRTASAILSQKKTEDSQNMSRLQTTLVCSLSACLLVMAGCNSPASEAQLPVISQGWQQAEIKDCVETVHDANIELAKIFKEAGEKDVPTTPQLKRVLICGAEMHLKWESLANDKYYSQGSAIQDAKVYPVRFFAAKPEPKVDPKSLIDNPSWSCQMKTDGIDCK